jgi:hypothetical protein
MDASWLFTSRGVLFGLLSVMSTQGFSLFSLVNLHNAAAAWIHLSEYYLALQAGKLRFSFLQRGNCFLSVKHTEHGEK